MPPQKPIQFLDLARQYRELKPELDAAVLGCLARGEFILGRAVADFEGALAAFLNVKPRQVVSCASGSDALLLALMACGIGPGDEVITTPFTFIATAGCVARLGAKPVFADINAQLNLAPEPVQACLTPRTKAVISVDLYGKLADHATLANICKQHGLIYISDSAQSLGNVFPNLADFTTYSFFPSKNLGCCGDGGALVCRNLTLSRKLRQLRAHGAKLKDKYSYDYIGINSRLDALQACILQVKLAHLSKWTAQRQAHAKLYGQLLQRVRNPQTSAQHVYHQYTILTKRRAQLQAYLQARGIPTIVYYPRPLHLQKCFKQLGYRRGACPNAEKYARQVLSLPVHENLTAADITYIAQHVNEFSA
jgi:dTDP-4-amino-4,6-dideoxygalactose transaminase